MKRFNKQTGGKGEWEAEKLLKKKGFKILEANWGNKWGELDLVCLSEEVVVFVEVKAKTGDGYGAPWQMVNKNKLERVRRMGRQFLIEKDWSDRACRIDVVGVVFDKDGEMVKIDHYENVY